MSLHALHRPLGRSGIFVSPLGLGTVKLGRNQGVKYPAQFRIPDDNEVRRLLSQASELGINLIDTAPAYGNSEERLGKLLRGQRKNWIIASKTGEEFIGTNSHFDFSAAHTRYSVERSLKRLQTDVIDLLLVHSNGDDINIITQEEVCATLAALKAEGKIRVFGFSGKSAEGNLLALQQDADCAMVTYNLASQSEREVLDYAAKQGKGILVKKALASGHACLDKEQSPLVASFALALGHIGVSAAIVGTINPAHLTQNAEAVESLLNKVK